MWGWSRTGLHTYRARSSARHGRRGIRPPGSRRPPAGGARGPLATRTPSPGNVPPSLSSAPVRPKHLCLGRPLPPRPPPVCSDPHLEEVGACWPLGKGVAVLTPGMPAMRPARDVGDCFCLPCLPRAAGCDPCGCRCRRGAVRVRTRCRTPGAGPEELETGSCAQMFPAGSGKCC